MIKRIQALSTIHNNRNDVTVKYPRQGEPVQQPGHLRLLHLSRQQTQTPQEEEGTRQTDSLQIIKPHISPDHRRTLKIQKGQGRQHFPTLQGTLKHHRESPF